MAIIVAMIAYGLHKKKKKSRVGSLSNGELNKMFFFITIIKLLFSIKSFQFLL